MFKRTMTFDDLDGNETQQTFYFNYNKKEIAELLEFKHLEEKLRLLTMPVEESGLTQQENNQQAYDIFQDLILDAYGEKGADNVTFLKTPTLRQYWASHVAFVEMIFEFLENPQLAAQFIENCLPAKMVAKAKAEMESENSKSIPSQTLSEMMVEADRRQQDPATRIEPGTSPEVEAMAQRISKDVLSGEFPKDESAGSTPAKKLEDLTEEDINAMDDVAFNKLDVQKLSKSQMMAAWKRKASQS